MDTDSIPLIIITSPDNRLGEQIKEAIPEGVIKVILFTVGIETTMTIIHNGTVTKIL